MHAVETPRGASPPCAAERDANARQVFDKISFPAIHDGIGLSYGVAFNPSGNLAYVTRYFEGTIIVIDVASNTVVNTIG